MVDYGVMWIHQRTGPNTGVSYGFRLGTIVFAGLIGLGLLTNLVGPGVAMLVLFLIPAVLAYATRHKRAEYSEYKRLVALEQKAAHEAELERLRSKYGD